MYDYLIVGAGLFGATFAHEATKQGKRCLVIDRRDHIGGNVYTEKIAGIDVHKYGAHIFHTNNKKIWDYVNQFATFNRYTNAPIANYKGEIYNLPFNMNTFNKLWQVTTPKEAQAKIAAQIEASGIKNPKNLEEQAISLVGTDIYEKLIKGYTEKQWGRQATDLPAFIIKRLPVRFTYDNNYFNDRYQGIPIGGYTQIIEQMLVGSDIKLDCDFFSDKQALMNQAKKVVFTGMIDQYYDYEYGILDYRSLTFETTLLEDTANFQGNAVVNYTDKETPFTRIIEHKHFDFGTQKDTIISKEFPSEWEKGDEPYYPVNDKKNETLYKKYKEKAASEDRVIFGGRLATYKYYDMHQVIGSALTAFQNELKNL